MTGRTIIKNKDPETVDVPIPGEDDKTKKLALKEDAVYIVEVPNKEFNGVSAGVRFSNGKAIVEKGMTLPAGASMARTIHSMVKDFGYHAALHVRG